MHFLHSYAEPVASSGVTNRMMHSWAQSLSTPHSQVADIYHHNRIWTFTCLEITTNLGESEKSQERRNTEAKM